MPMTEEQATTAALSAITNPSPAQIAAATEVALILASGTDDSFIDVHQLFALYNALYFRSLLMARVELTWSPRLTLCAGICELTRDKTTRQNRVKLKLSEPLLKYRPRSDLLNTLLHESIHAYFFVVCPAAHIRDPDGGHGAGFTALADAINGHGGYGVTQFHTFHDEVDSYRTHVWLCDGPCRLHGPYFGLVKRAMNRAPGKSDGWWERHARECGGVYVKMGEPEMSRAQVEKLTGLKRAGRQKNKIDGWVKGGKKDEIVGDKTSNDAESKPLNSMKRALSSEIEAGDQGLKVALIACPICDKSIKDIYINEHLDAEHPP
ncbi:hypothetical protein BT63DRAFT_294081 [Microthyrium microscopicum]|uniref:Protein with SprT-like domain at the N terminus n=1 Tax=Microthyrium microscopicum TaxID=703497 RepID=A0A6A6U791_9PEZI|nr:hypothetical protein BT63DRAFT_294081 [Microthyrium microscopicum]